jgi:hypothetical protein
MTGMTGGDPGPPGPGSSGPGESGAGPSELAGGTGPRTGLRAAAAVLAVLAALGIALVASRSGPPFATPGGGRPGSAVQTLRPAPARTPPFEQPSPDQPPPRTLSHLAGLYLLVAAGLMFLGLAAVPLMLPRWPRLRWRQMRRSARAPAVPLPVTGPAVPQALADVVEVALRRLEGGPVTDAIVACWVGLEEAAARAGTRRLPAQTSAELTERVLAEHRVSPATLRRLAELYREARFSGHRLGDDARADARALFQRVRHELRASR